MRYEYRCEKDVCEVSVRHPFSKMYRVFVFHPYKLDRECDKYDRQADNEIDVEELELSVATGHFHDESITTLSSKSTVTVELLKFSVEITFKNRFQLTLPSKVYIVDGGVH